MQQICSRWLWKHGDKNLKYLHKRSWSWKHSGQRRNWVFKSGIASKCRWEWVKMSRRHYSQWKHYSLQASLLIVRQALIAQSVATQAVNPGVARSFNLNSVNSLSDVFNQWANSLYEKSAFCLERLLWDPGVTWMAELAAVIWLIFSSTYSTLIHHHYLHHKDKRT